MLTPLFIKYLLMTNTGKEPFVTLIVPILSVLLISQYRSTNSLKYEIALFVITIFQTDCSSFVYWDNYSIHSMNKTSFKIRKPYNFYGWNRTKRIDLFVRIEQYRRKIEKLPNYMSQLSTDFHRYLLN